VTHTPNGGAPGYVGPNMGEGPPLKGFLGYFDDGSGNPNNPGQFTHGNINFSTGGDKDPNSAPPTTFTAATSPNNQEYQNWTWEEIINTVMSLSLPDRSVVNSGRWTGIEQNSDGDSGRFYIFGMTWSDRHKDALVYLSPELLQPNAPWPAFWQRPNQALGSLTPGPDSLFQADGSLMSLDPSTFAGPVQSLASAEAFYSNAVLTLNGILAGLGNDSTQFQGQAGGAFTQLMGNIYQQVNYVSATMGTPSDLFSSYSQALYFAGLQADIFMYQLYNAYAAWTNLLEFSPLGAILAALIAGGVVVGSPGNWNINSQMDPNYSPYGQLSTDAAWVNVETAAKNLWIQGLAKSLDYGAQAGINALVHQYNNTMINLQLLSPPSVHQISDTSGSGNSNANGLGGLGNYLDSAFSGIGNSFGDIGNAFSDLGGVLGNAFDDIGGAFGGIGNAFGGIGNAFGDFSGDVGNAFGDFSGDLGNAFGDIGGAFGGVGNAFSDIGGAFSGIGNSFDDFSGAVGNAFGDIGSAFGGVGNAFSDIGDAVGGVGNAIGDLGATSSGVGDDGQDQATEDTLLSPTESTGSVSNAVQSALVDNEGTQSALESALSSGQVSPNSQLYGTLQNALADSNLTQQALDQAAGGTGSTTSPVEQALDDNGNVQSDLNSALSSGQVPANSKLSDSLNSALADSKNTEQALNQAAAAGGNSTSALKSALADNSATESALKSALASGQVPANSQLAHTLQNALGQSEKTQSALTQALSGGSAQGSLLTTAASENSGTQNALTQALVSGQVPATGPLHSTLASALADTGKTQSAINQALTSGTTSSSAALNRALTDNQAVQKELRSALASGQVPATGPLRNDLNQALADSDKLSTTLHQALASQKVLAEPNVSALSSPVSVAGTGTSTGLTSSSLGNGLTSGTSGTSGSGLASSPLVTSTGTGSLATAGSSAPVSSGRFVSPTATQTQATTSAASGESAFPMYSPMAGGGGMMGSQAGNQEQERERSTWLAEDEDVWGTDPDVGPHVIGRDFGMDDEPEDYDVFAERSDRQEPRRAQSRRMDGR
jgi:hypothetical protein